MKKQSYINRVICLSALLAATLGMPAHVRADGPTTAASAEDFLNSIGVNSGINQRGETLQKTIDCTKYLGVRWFRAGTEGGLPMENFIDLHKQTGARFSWSPGSGGSDLPKLIATAKQLAAAGALLAFEGPNEPNNWGVTYQGQAGGGGAKSWLAVANLQRDLYKMVNSDPLLKGYPVWSISENGAETDNVGLQFLTVPRGAGTLVPDGTKFADFANVHNYVYHPNSRGIEDNKTWNASDPTPACKVDGLYGEYGLTWGRHYKGYSVADLLTLPRVTTETGCTIDGPVTEDIHALNLLSLYLDQYKRGWSHTAVYLLRDRVDEGGNQKFAFYRPDYTPRKAAVYLHNLTTILAEPPHPLPYGPGGTPSHTGRTAPTRTLKPGRLNYSIPAQPNTVHDLLLQKRDGSLALVVWSELVKGTNAVTVNLGASFPAVTLYDPTVGTAPTQTLRNVAAVPLLLSDHPVIIELPASIRRSSR